MPIPRKVVAHMSDGSLLFDTRVDTSGLTNGLSSAGGVAAKGLGIATKAVAAVSTGILTVGAGIGALATASVKAYSNYEQYVGGVETLFKDSSQKVLDYSKDAYKTAGLSANDYMDTVTSFSASLLQSLGGDTDKAAEEANKAIVDMSDNANKMGSSMGSITDAYKGFAKQNYTMLDNLKLGYGGTKEEMERLLTDATTLSGIDYDISSYADVVDAIHVVQDNLGITGTTAEEASTTIQGSISSMQSAFTNFLTGMADPDQDFDALLNNLIDSVLTVADNLIPRFMETVPRLVEGLTELISELATYIPGVMEELFPVILDGASSLISSLTESFPQILEVIGEIAPTLVELAIQLLASLGQALIDNAPAIIETVQSIIDSVLESIGDLVPQISPLTDAMQFIIDNIGTITLVLIPLVAGILAYIAVQKALTLATKTQTLAQKAMNFMMNLNPIGVTIALIVALIAIVVILWNKCDWFREGVTAIIDKIVGTFKASIALIKVVVSAIIEFFKSIPGGIKDAFSGLGDFFGGLWDKIVTKFTDLGTKIGDAVGGAFKAVVNAIISTAENTINGFFGLINGAISIINKIPGVELSKIDDVSFPRLETGGILAKGQTGFLEGNGAEAVVPLDKNKYWIAAVAKEFEQQTNNATTAINYKKLATTYVDALADAELGFSVDKRVFSRLIRGAI